MKLVLELDLEQECAMTARRAITMMEDVLDSMKHTIPANASLGKTAQDRAPGKTLYLAEAVDADDDGVRSDTGVIARVFVVPEDFDHSQLSTEQCAELGVGLKEVARAVQL